MINIKYLINLSGPYHSRIKENSHYLSDSLSTFDSVLVFERPSFNNTLKLLLLKQHFFEKISDNLLIIHSLSVIPKTGLNNFIYSLNYKINYQLIKRYKKINLNYAKIISFTPDIYYLDNYLDLKRAYYYIKDNYLFYKAWKGNKGLKYFKNLENKFLRKCKNIIASSKEIQKKYYKKDRNIYYFPNPSKIADFTVNNFDCPNELKCLKKPLIGFFGGIEDYRIDFNLIRYVTSILRDCSFVFIGPIGESDKKTKKSIVRSNNIYYLGYKDKSLLPNYLKYFNICIIPYKLNDYGKMCFPLKISEYFTLGKPVVTTALPSIKQLKNNRLIYWSKTKKEFVENVKLALKEPVNSKLVHIRKEFANKNDWSIRIKKLISIIN